MKTNLGHMKERIRARRSNPETCNTGIN